MAAASPGGVFLVAGSNGNSLVADAMTALGWEATSKEETARAKVRAPPAAPAPPQPPPPSRPAPKIRAPLGRRGR